MERIAKENIKTLYRCLKCKHEEEFKPLSFIEIKRLWLAIQTKRFNHICSKCGDARTPDIYFKIGIFKHTSESLFKKYYQLVNNLKYRSKKAVKRLL